MFLYLSKPLSDPTECGLIGATEKVSGGKKVSGRKKVSDRKKVSGRKKSGRRKKKVSGSLFFPVLIIIKESESSKYLESDLK